MKRNIIIIVLSIITLVALGNSLVQRIEAARQSEIAIMNLEIVEEAKKETVMAMSRANVDILVAERATEAKLKAEEKLKNCKQVMLQFAGRGQRLTMAKKACQVFTNPQHCLS